MSDSSALLGRKWEPAELAQLITDHGHGDWNGVNCLSVILAESGGYEWAVNVVNHRPEAVTYRSIDLGICQWNSHWMPLTVQQAMHAPTAIAQMLDIAKREGKWRLDFELWTTWKNEANRAHIGAAFQAFKTIGVL